jgi:hypothetical protein
MRILYPDLVYGAIASSGLYPRCPLTYSRHKFSYAGVTHACLELWQYLEVIRLAAEPECASSLENSIQTIDNILSHQRISAPLKALFGLAGLKHDEDFASLIAVSCSHLSNYAKTTSYTTFTCLGTSFPLAGKKLGSQDRKHRIRQLLLYTNQAPVRALRCC